MGGCKINRGGAIDKDAAFRNPASDLLFAVSSWLGVVDEVTGSGLQSDREMIEMILSAESAARKP